jgi:hypothetical protein
LPSSQMGFEHADAEADDTCDNHTVSNENGDGSTCNGGAANVNDKDANNSRVPLAGTSTTTSSAPTLTSSKASTAMATTMATILVACINERSLQKSLTVPPLVYGQAVTEAKSNSMPDVVHRMQRGLQPSKWQTRVTTSCAADATAASSSSTCILHRPIKPRLFLGTRSSLASIHSYLAPGPGPSNSSTRTTKWVRMPRDGTTILLEWEFARLDANSIPLTPQALSRPVVLILYGLTTIMPATATFAA